jgi:hypothetical protein
MEALLQNSNSTRIDSLSNSTGLTQGEQPRTSSLFCPPQGDNETIHIHRDSMAGVSNYALPAGVQGPFSPPLSEPQKTRGQESSTFPHESIGVKDNSREGPIDKEESVLSPQKVYNMKPLIELEDLHIANTICV